MSLQMYRMGGIYPGYDVQPTLVGIWQCHIRIPYRCIAPNSYYKTARNVTVGTYPNLRARQGTKKSY
ncbi:hypothetical protein H6F74_13635 [Trichocoleus sp. FACHB-90]|uniref:hypothetical protein n=1 Tax=Cyanophyceae TaxID=3028117 RepID=UPI001683C9C2|nr:hypothetical protein [Trichocoleus sp. FACHB-90]MBD1927276.1 hypothetical protein [Trichocoleus sp. FACHB-90]